MNKLRSLLTLLVVSICSVHSAWADVEINETNFPDANFRNYLLNQTYGSDGVITDAEIAEVTSIDVSGWYNIASLKGIEFFTALTELNCGDKQLTALDVSKNTALTTLNCGYNQLTALDVSKNTALTTLNCSRNQLTALDVSKNTALTTLNCGYNQLTALDVSKNTALTTLNCGGNQWTALDVSGCTALTTLKCSENKRLTSLNVSGCTALTTLECTENKRLTSLNVSGCTALTTLECGDDQLTALDVSGCTALKKLYCSSNQLTSLDVSGCTALRWLTCSNNQLTSLDVSNNTALEDLFCDNNQLTTLDVSGCTALSTLNCDNNQLTTLDVSKNTALTQLNCYFNQLTALDVSKNTALTTLNCGGNQLTTLDLSKNTALTELSCSSNQLTALDVSNNTALTELNCDNNQLTALDVSNNTALKYLYCNNNQLTALDLSNNTALNSLYCSSNQIKGEAMDALIASLPQQTDYSYRTLRVIYFENEGNVMTAKQVAAAKAKGWTPYYCAGKIYQYGDNWQEYAGSEPEINKTNFPDVNFRNWLLSQSYGSDGVITDAEIAEVTSIDVSSKSIASLKGIEFFTALKSLNCSNNQLTSLNVSGNTALTTLRCNNNIRLYSLDVSKNTTLTTLDVSNNTALEYLYCNNNQLTALDVSGCTALKYLYCDNNQLTALDVSKNTALYNLDCSGNQLTTLDVSKNTALYNLDCSGNQLTALDVSGCTALYNLDCSGNQLTALDVSGCTALYSLVCYNNQLTALDLSKNTEMGSLDCYRNQIKGAAMDALIASLRTLKYEYTFHVIYFENEGNVMTTTQVATAKAKGWTPMYCTGLTYDPGWDYTFENWSEYAGSEPVAIEPIEKETTVSFGGTSGVDESTDLSNTAVNDVLYTLNNTAGNGYDNTDQSITITSVVSDANIAEAEALTPGTPEFAEKFNGITIELAAGTGSVTFDCQTIGNRVLTVKIGNAPAATYSKSERGEVKVAYNVAAPTYMYVYATAVAGARGSEPTAIENALKLYGFTVKPGDPTAIEGIESDTSASKSGSDVYFDLSGRRVTAPTKGVYVKNGRKVVVK